MLGWASLPFTGCPCGAFGGTTGTNGAGISGSAFEILLGLRTAPNPQPLDRGPPVGRKQDLREVDRIAKQFGMDEDTRKEFGDYLEDCKRAGDRGSKNERGDFTWEELEAMAREFLAPGEGQ